VTSTVYIGFGSNLGDRVANIAAALVRLRRSEFELASVSSVYETGPVGVTDQPDFLNGAACFITKLSPMQVLSACREAEKFGGRVRRQRWGPRSIDLDLLLYDSLQICTEELTVPHPEMANRRFVLQPLAEIAPELIVPGFDKTVNRLLEEADAGRVQMVAAAEVLMNMIKEV
jgi:2-amino-4-hydroxy-6-hydroxymethyldihydropteridine diphosphokinase